MEQLKRILRFSARALVDRKYRNRVLDVVNRHVTASTPVPEGHRLAAGGNSQWISGRRMYLVGGCELSYIEDFFGELGVETHHTFDHGGAPEPLGEALNPESPLWSFRPDYVVLSQTQVFTGLVFKLQAEGAPYTREQQDEHLGELRAAMQRSIRKIRERLEAPVFLMTYLLEYRPALGIHEYRSLAGGYSLIELIRRYELMLYEVAREEAAVYVLDVTLALEDAGKRGSVDAMGGDGIYDHFSREGASRVAARLLYQCAAIEPAVSRVKCVAVDLDGTMWSGVLREDGPAGIAPRVSYRRVLRHLARRGILLAVCSKNDPIEASRLPDLLGKPLSEKISVRKLNWGPKSASLRQIAQELNIGLDAIAFFDDSPFERAEVEANAPGVRVFRDVDLPTCLERPEFEPLGELTAEAAARAERYVQQGERETAAASAESIEAFLQSCRLELTLRRPVEGEISRLHELLARTNQLNATLRRTSLADIQRYYGSPDRFELRAALLADKFGDYGLIGLAIAQRDASRWSLLELAFSCRAMGKHVEHALLLHLSGCAQRAGAERLEIDFRSTDRNQQLLSILRSVGFAPDGEAGEGAVRLQCKLSEGLADSDYPAWLRVRE